jgi:hypothetical protein
MFLREEAHISPGSKRNTLYQLAAGCIKSMCRLGSNDEAQTLSDCLSQKKNSITIKDTASQMTTTKMTEVKVNYTILRNKCCRGTYSWQAFPRKTVKVQAS